ncbi:hypothetical protein [Halomonas sp. MS1]|nr:hypothetical protein [Halomonas sp. MS1]UTD56638.1 hypothetical protein NF683_05295 [Halomonas sp. MS1]
MSRFIQNSVIGWSQEDSLPQGGQYDRRVAGVYIPSYGADFYHHHP